MKTEDISVFRAAHCRRILVIGSPGAGKSTLSRKLGSILHLPVIHLDQLWHKPDRTTVSREQFDRLLQSELDQPEWILDGNYARTLQRRIEKAQLIVFLDYPARLCEQSVEERIGKPRADMPWIEDSFDPEFRRYIRRFRQDHRGQILQELDRAKRQNRQVVILHDRQEAEAWLQFLAQIRSDASESRPSDPDDR